MDREGSVRKVRTWRVCRTGPACVAVGELHFCSTPVHPFQPLALLRHHKRHPSLTHIQAFTPSLTLLITPVDRVRVQPQAPPPHAGRAGLPGSHSFWPSHPSQSSHQPCGFWWWWLGREVVGAQEAHKSTAQNVGGTGSVFFGGGGQSAQRKGLVGGNKGAGVVYSLCKQEVITG